MTSHGGHDVDQHRGGEDPSLAGTNTGKAGRPPTPGLPVAAALAGREARYYVRGAMDPLYASPVRRDAYAQFLARWVSASAAARFLAGWATHHDTTHEIAPVVAWHRLIGATRIEVGSAA